MKLVIESTIALNQFIRKHRMEQIQTEGLKVFELGKCYPNFNMLEPFVETYDVDMSKLEVGDIIVRDWQYGHLPNTGYRPVEVTEILGNTQIIVSNDKGQKYTICTDPILMKDRVYHKLDKSFIMK